MKVSKVPNLLIRLCAQFNPASVPTNTIRTWISMKVSTELGSGRLQTLKAWYHLSPPWHVHEEYS